MVSSYAKGASRAARCGSWDVPNLVRPHRDYSSPPTSRMARVGSIWLKASLEPRQDLVLRSALHSLGWWLRILIGRQHF
jgi:hypothetical protein